MISSFSLRAGHQAGSPAGDIAARLFWTILTGGAVAVLAVRLWLLPGIALWNDESWTLMIVRQPEWAGFWREAWRDPNAPLYYLLLRCWTMMAGDGDIALRIPGLLCGATAAALPLLWRIRGLSRGAQAGWGLMILCWMPGIPFSLEARCYSLLLLLATAQTIAFATMLERPTPQRATRWAILAALAFLTHYFAAFLIIAQAMLFPLREWRRARRLWPALLPFVPAGAWALWHLPRLLHYAAPGVGWYGRIGLNDAWQFPAFMVGPVIPYFLPLLLPIAGAGLWSARGRGMPAAGLVRVAAAGLLAVALAMIAGMTRPMLSPRYLTPAVPAVLLGLVLAMRGGARPRTGLVVMLAPFLAVAVKAEALSAFLAERGRAGWQDGSDFVARAHPDRLVFAADDPGSRSVDPRSLAQAGAAMLVRDGQRPAAVAMTAMPGGDPSAALVAATAGAARPAILWFHDRRGEVADTPRPALTRLSGWHCRWRGETAFAMLACIPSAPGGGRDATAPAR